jgi:hypothetical protein
MEEGIMQSAQSNLSPAVPQHQTPPESPMTRDDSYASPEHNDLRTPKLRVGDPAFDFTLPRLDVHRRATGELVHLGDHFGQQPVALIFGSYT